MSSACNRYYFMVERLASNFAIYPIGNVNDAYWWVDDERILTAVNQLDHGCLYLNCASIRFSSIK